MAPSPFIWEIVLRFNVYMFGKKKLQNAVRLYNIRILAFSQNTRFVFEKRKRRAIKIHRMNFML